MSDTNKKKKTSRRKFLIRGGLGTIGVLALGTYVFRNPLRRKAYEMGETMVPPFSGTGTEANLWFEINQDNTVTLHSPKVEMGQGTFTSLAQIVADELDVNINQIIVKDYNKDGHLDAVVAGNLYSSEVETPRNDAAIGLYLQGDGKGNFLAVPSRESGLYIPGDVKDLVEMKIQGESYLIAAKNSDYLQFIKVKTE